MSLSRRDRILVLAWSLPDALRVLEGRNSETRRLSPAAWQLCVPCDGSGQTQDRWGRPSTCLVCRGAGRYRTDPYADGAVVSGADDRLAPRVSSRSVKCDRCAGDGVIPGRWVGVEGLVACPSCDGSGSLQVPLVADLESRSQAAGTGLDSVTWSFRGGDWDALDAALEVMRCNGRRSLWRAFVAAFVEPPYAGSAAALDGLGQVEAMMPSRVRVPDEVVVAWTQRVERQRLAAAKRSGRMGRDHRRREIRAALRLGHSTADVARMFAVSERTVERIDA